MFIVLGAGAFFDVKEHRIPNWWVLAGIISGILLLVLESEEPVSSGVFLKMSVLFLLRMTVVILIFLVLFLLRMMGAGDIKMAALICGYLGFREGILAVAWGLFLGAVWSFLKLLLTGRFLNRISYFLAYFKRLFQTGKITAYYKPKRDGYGDVIPLGLCLFVGTVCSFLMAG